MLNDAFGLLSTTSGMQPILRAIKAGDEPELLRLMQPAAILFTDLDAFSICPLAEGLHRVWAFETALAPLLVRMRATLVKAEGDSHLVLAEQVSALVGVIEGLQAVRPALAFSAGMDYGPVLLCRHHWKRLDVYGPHVSRASRFGEDWASQGQILLSLEAYAQLDRAVQQRCRSFPVQGVMAFVLELAI